MHTTRDTLYLVEFRQARLRRERTTDGYGRAQPAGWLLHRPVIKRGKERRRDKGLTKEEEEKEKEEEAVAMREEEGRRSRKGEKSGDEHEVR